MSPWTQYGSERYLELSRAEIARQLRDIEARPRAGQGGARIPFLPVETLLCYGLFLVMDPHRYGGSNIDDVPLAVKQLAAFCRRTPGSITSKMLNLDGSRRNGARAEPALFTALTAEPALYASLYRDIHSVARALGIDEASLPDYLGMVAGDAPTQVTTLADDGSSLLGQDDLPVTTTALLADGELRAQLATTEEGWGLGDEVTERLVVGRVRLAQHRFAGAVLANCASACVFCGFAPLHLPARGGLLRASHIKPWARSSARERVDVRNGVAACPMHDAAFDRGYLAIGPDGGIERSPLLDRSLAAGDPGVRLYFGEVLAARLILPAGALRPGPTYARYHRDHTFLSLVAG
jgi:putative restriction endonuclease